MDGRCRDWIYIGLGLVSLCPPDSRAGWSAAGCHSRQSKAAKAQRGCNKLGPLWLKGLVGWSKMCDYHICGVLKSKNNVNLPLNDRIRCMRCSWKLTVTALQIPRVFVSFYITSRVTAWLLCWVLMWRNKGGKNYPWIVWRQSHFVFSQISCLSYHIARCSGKTFLALYLKEKRKEKLVTLDNSVDAM